MKSVTKVYMEVIAASWVEFGFPLRFQIILARPSAFPFARGLQLQNDAGHFKCVNYSLATVKLEDAMYRLPLFLSLQSTMIKNYWIQSRRIFQDEVRDASHTADFLLLVSTKHCWVSELTSYAPGLVGLNTTVNFIFRMKSHSYIFVLLWKIHYQNYALFSSKPLNLVMHCDLVV